MKEPNLGGNSPKMVQTKQGRHENKTGEKNVSFQSVPYRDLHHLNSREIFIDKHHERKVEKYSLFKSCIKTI